MTIFDDMRETLGAALKLLGYSLNSRDEKQLAEARDVVIGWKRNIAKFDNEGYKAGLDSGEFLLVQGYSGDLWQVAQENDKVAIVIPKEGVSLSCDEMVIPKNAPNPKLAHAFINFLLDPEVSAENMEWMGYLCPNTPAQIAPVASDAGTPRRIISGTPDLPIAAAVAGLEPQIAEKMPQARMFAMTRPPGTRSSHRCSDS
jgi:spermidine/putrescine-binding protein